MSKTDAPARISDARLEELRALCDAASGPPWIVDDPPHGNGILSVNEAIEMDDGSIHPAFDTIIGYMQVSNSPNFRNDAAFIAAAREAVPALLSEVAALRAELETKDVHIANLLHYGSVVCNAAHNASMPLLEATIDDLRSTIEAQEGEPCNPWRWSTQAERDESPPLWDYLRAAYPDDAPTYVPARPADPAPGGEQQ